MHILFLLYIMLSVPYMTFENATSAHNERAHSTAIMLLNVQDPELPINFLVQHESLSIVHSQYDSPAARKSHIIASEILAFLNQDQMQPLHQIQFCLQVQDLCFLFHFDRIQSKNAPLPQAMAAWDRTHNT